MIHLGRVDVAEIERVGAFARMHGLDMSAHVVEADPFNDFPVLFEKAKRKPVEKIARRIESAMDRGHPWPVDLPLILVCRRPEGGYWLLDGHHRLAAAREMAPGRIPVIEIDCRTADMLRRNPVHGGLGMTVWRAQEVLAEFDPLMKVNWGLLSAGERERGSRRTGR